MKKFLSVLLVVVMLLSVVGVMTGCGDKKADTKETEAKGTEAKGTEAKGTETNGTEAKGTEANKGNEDAENKDEATLPAALANIVKADIPDLIDYGWYLAGGMIDGVEMEQEDLGNILEGFGGRMDFRFTEEGKVALVTNIQEPLQGTYEVTDKVLFIEFKDYKYNAVFTEIEGNLVMVVVNKAEPNSALYFLLIEEG